MWQIDVYKRQSLKHPIRENKILLLEIVSRIAFEIFKKSEKEIYYIRAKELDAIVNEFNLEPSNAKWIRKCCVLCAYWRSDGKDGALEFYHNNIRDYFFGEYIYNTVSYTHLVLDIHSRLYASVHPRNAQKHWTRAISSLPVSMVIICCRQWT